jgi:tetratricopeptide (TPR) repeat protein
MERGDSDAAIAAYEEALEITPWNTRVTRALAAAHAERGARRREAGSLPEAERDLRRALELQPDDPELRLNLAIVLIERADLEMDRARATKMRVEAAELAPELHAGSPQVDALLERRLDLAYELLERGQLEAGASRLEWLQADYPDEPRVKRLRAQSEVALGGDRYQKGAFDAAAEHYGNAVALYAGCDPAVCSRQEVALAHQNRVVALYEARKTAEARAALDEAEKQGHRFPELRAMLPEYDF